MSLEPFRLVIPPGPLTHSAVQAQVLAALTAARPSEAVPTPIRWAIVAETAAGRIVEGIVESQPADVRRANGR